MNPADLSREGVLDLIGIGRGSQAGIFIPFQFVEWLGGYEAAALLTQILFWRDVARADGKEEFYQSYDGWRKELRLTERQVRNALDEVRKVGVITRARRDPAGNRVLFYRVDAAVFLTALMAFLSGGSVRSVPAETTAPDTALSRPSVQNVRADKDESYDGSNEQNRSAEEITVCADPPRVAASPDGFAHTSSLTENIRAPTLAAEPDTGEVTIPVAPAPLIDGTWEPDPALRAEFAGYAGDLDYQVRSFCADKAGIAARAAPRLFRRWMLRADPALEPHKKSGGPADPTPAFVYFDPDRAPTGIRPPARPSRPKGDSDAH